MATATKTRKPIRKLHTVIAKLEALQWGVADSADNCDINAAKDALMRLLRKWEDGR